MFSGCLNEESGFEERGAGMSTIDYIEYGRSPVGEIRVLSGFLKYSNRVRAGRKYGPTCVPEFPQQDSAGWKVPEKYSTNR